MKYLQLCVILTIFSVASPRNTDDNTDWPIDPITGCRFPAVLREVATEANLKNFNFSGVQEVQFLAIVGPVEQKRICKIKCVNGNWLGPLCSIEEDGGRFQPMLRHCSLEHVPSDVIFFYNGQKLEAQWDVQLAHGTLLNMRCRQIGIFKFVGNSTLRCRNGQWDRRLPVCIPTTYLTNFSAYSPPTIIYQLPQGSAAPTDTGELVVYPGSIVHLDCFYRRQEGNPYWSWTPSYRQYPMGWAVPFHEKDWKYRLSLYYAKNYDSGVYTCTTPKGSSNTISIRVKAVECPDIKTDGIGQNVAFEGTKINHRARFSCIDGSILVGSEEITCLWTGKWSHDFPLCHTLQCANLVAEELHLKIESQNVSHKGIAAFSCPKGFRLIGSDVIICLYGNWSDVMPICEEVFCEAPLPPSNGRIVDKGIYKVESQVKYICDIGHNMVGDSDVLKCLISGNWSHTPPICQPKCRHPGDPVQGRTSPSKEFFDMGEWVTVMCNSGHTIHGTQRLQCNEPNKWSSLLPELLYVFNQIRLISSRIGFLHRKWRHRNQRRKTSNTSNTFDRGSVTSLASRASVSGPSEQGSEFGSVRSLAAAAPSNLSVYHVDLKTKDRTFTKLHRAAWLGDLEKVKKQVKKDDVNGHDVLKRTPLHLACAHGNKEVVWFLLGCKGNLGLHDYEGYTPFLRVKTITLSENILKGI
uniref:Locomotion-related protein Hikaru genki n=1 Tax=Strigamia maritima TaxID=126957 RepID=T1JJD6_STRMM